MVKQKPRPSEPASPELAAAMAVAAGQIAYRPDADIEDCAASLTMHPRLLEILKQAQGR